MKILFLFIAAMGLTIVGAAQKFGGFESFTHNQLHGSKVLNSINYHLLTSSKKTSGPLVAAVDLGYAYIRRNGTFLTLELVQREEFEALENEADTMTNTYANEAYTLKMIGIYAKPGMKAQCNVFRLELYRKDERQPFLRTTAYDTGDLPLPPSRSN